MMSSLQFYKTTEKIMANNNIKAKRVRNNYNYGKKLSKHGAAKRQSENYPDKNKNLLRSFLNSNEPVSAESYQEILEMINANGKNAKDEYTPLGKAAYKKLQTMMEANKKTPSASPSEISLEDRINNEFDEMAVSVAYGKSEAEKNAAVKKFADYIEKNVSPEKMDAVKTQIDNRLKDDDFVYGSEFIDLVGLRGYQDKMLPVPASESEHELSDNQPQRPLNRPQSDRRNEQDLYQALVDGINNEEIKNPHKGYSNDDLKVILAHHDRLLENTDGNGTNFESLYENSNSDLKKFASGALTIDNDSYDTMLDFIKIFGTDSKGRLTPDGKAAYDKLMGLMAEAQKQKNSPVKEKKQPQKDDDKAPAAAVLGIVDSLRDNATNREKKEKNKNKDKDNIIPVVPVIVSEEEQQNKTEKNKKEDKDKNIIPVIPVVNTPDNKGNDFIPPANNNPKAKKESWLKRKWKKIAAIAAVAAATLFGLSQCKGCTKEDDKKEDKKEVVTPTPAPVPAPEPQPEVKLTEADLNNGFFLERSAGFKGEQSAAKFADAEKTNKTEMLNLKKLLTKGELNLDSFVRNQGSKLKEDISIVEIAYKLRIVAQNFPNSPVAHDINNVMKGNAKDANTENIYTAFNRVDDYGNVLNRKGEKIKTIPGAKKIDRDRRGQGSEEYGTKGTFDNFMQVLNNHRSNLKD